MTDQVTIDLKEQLQSLLNMPVDLNICQIGAIQWAINQVAISKTETTSAKKIVVDIQLRPMLDELEVDIDEVKEYISKLKGDKR